MKTKKNKQEMIIKDMNGRLRRIEQPNNFGNLIGGLASVLIGVAIASIALSITTTSLKESGILDNHLESGIGRRAREVTRV